MPVRLLLLVLLLLVWRFLMSLEDRQASSRPSPPPTPTLSEVLPPSLPPSLPLEYFRGVKRTRGRGKVGRGKAPIQLGDTPCVVARGLTPQLLRQKYQLKVSLLWLAALIRHSFPLSTLIRHNGPSAPLAISTAHEFQLYKLHLPVFVSVSDYC